MYVLWFVGKVLGIAVINCLKPRKDSQTTLPKKNSQAETLAKKDWCVNGMTLFVKTNGGSTLKIGNCNFQRNLGKQWVRPQCQSCGASQMMTDNILEGISFIDNCIWDHTMDGEKRTTCNEGPHFGQDITKSSFANLQGSHLFIQKFVLHSSHPHPGKNIAEFGSFFFKFACEGYLQSTHANVKIK